MQLLTSIFHHDTTYWPAEREKIDKFFLTHLDELRASSITRLKNLLLFILLKKEAKWGILLEC